MENEIIKRARQMFVERNKVSAILERAALSGAYDNGTYIQQYLAEAEAELLRNKAESIEE